MQGLAAAYEANRRGRDMVPASRLAQSLQPRGDIAAALDDAIAKYGFRVVDTRVDSNAARPRFCATFSEPLVQAVDLDMVEGALRLNAPAFATVDAQYLFGAPGSDLVVEGDLRLPQRDSVEGWPGYRFGRHDARFSSQRSYFDGGRTDAEGMARVALQWPDVTAEDVLPEAVTTMRVSDSGGRPVEPEAAMIGIRAGFDDVLPEGGNAGFDLVAVGAASLPVQWTVDSGQGRDPLAVVPALWQLDLGTGDTPHPRRTRRDGAERDAATAGSGDAMERLRAGG